MGIMAPLRLLPFACVALLLGKISGVASNTTISYDVKVEKEGSCLTDINTARQAVGFANFVQATAEMDGKRLPDGVTGKGDTEFQNTAWEPVCKVLLQKTSNDPLPSARTEVNQFQTGTYAFKSLKSDSPECSTIVEEWKGAYKNFNGVLPPPKSGGTELYSDRNNISFVAMYNPSSGATADCRVVTCTKTVTESSRELPEGPQETTETGYALICMTVPDVLPEKESKAPFTEEQWNQIVTAFEGSASTVLPSLLALAATAFTAAVSVL